MPWKKASVHATVMNVVIVVATTSAQHDVGRSILLSKLSKVPVCLRCDQME